MQLRPVVVIFGLYHYAFTTDLLATEEHCPEDLFSLVSNVTPLHHLVVRRWLWTLHYCCMVVSAIQVFIHKQAFHNYYSLRVLELKNGFFHTWCHNKYEVIQYWCLEYDTLMIQFTYSHQRLLFTHDCFTIYYNFFVTAVVKYLLLYIDWIILHSCHDMYGHTVNAFNEQLLFNSNIQ